jgi:PTS system mannose-specific IIA component
MNEKVLLGVVLVTHGQLGEVLLSVAGMIVGDIDHMQSVSIGWHSDVEASKRQIEAAVDSVDAGKGVVILTDMFGGTPSNISLSLMKKDRLEVITGVNLPMVIKLANQKGTETLAELVTAAKSQGQSQISIPSELLGE